jgi:hypothetical protein
VLVEMGGDAGARDVTEVHAHVEPLGAAGVAQRLEGALGELGQLGRLAVVQFGVVGHVPIGADHQVAGVVGIKVQHRVDDRAAGDDQPFLVVELRDPAERAGLRA